MRMAHGLLLIEMLAHTPPLGVQLLVVVLLFLHIGWVWMLLLPVDTWVCGRQYCRYNILLPLVVVCSGLFSIPLQPLLSRLPLPHYFHPVQILTLSVLLASDVARHGIGTMLPCLSGTIRVALFCAGCQYCHWFFCHSKSISYQKHFSGTNAPPDACSSPAQWVTAFCIFCAIICSSGWMVMHRSVSSTKANPASCILFILST